MHYKNGRPASNGDKIVLFTSYPSNAPVCGVLYNALAGNDYCNGMLAPFSGGQHMCPNLKECIHLEDFMAAQPKNYPDTTVKE
jgi:hypothetical protein